MFGLNELLDRGGDGLTGRGLTERLYRGSYRKRLMRGARQSEVVWRATGDLRLTHDPPQFQRGLTPELSRAAKRLRLE